MTHKRATRIAETIVRYWKARGYAIHAWVEREPYSKDAQSAGYTVRTNLVNGLPDNYRPSLIADLTVRPFIEI